MFNIFKNKIISEKEKNTLLDWIYKNEDRFIQNPAGPHRKYYRFTHDPNVPLLFFNIKERILKKENIKFWREEPMYMDYIGWISNGGFIHMHKDEESNNLLRHVRYNLFLSVPHKGGDPVYNEKKLKMKEREYVICNSGSEYHRCKLVEGNKPRIVISYGVLIE